jgi:ABC-2 type transport system ATP-binding protein
VHPGRSARNHLAWLAASNGLPRKRVGEVLDMVGLTSVAGKRLKTYSLGMKQRLGLAGVLLGDPHTIILDEPANGLDPEGVRWIREVLTTLAHQGRTVLVSSHLLSEMALMADDLVVIGQGRLIEQSSVGDFVERFADRWVQVVSPAAPALVAAAAAAGWHARQMNVTTAEIRGTNAATIGELAAAKGWVLHELSPQTGSLEDAFLKATATVQEYSTHGFGAASSEVAS